jgi:hypothetical protein
MWTIHHQAFSYLEFNLNILHTFDLFFGSKVSEKKKDIQMLEVWLGPDSNRMLLLTVAKHIGMRNRCGPSTTEPFFPLIEPQYTKQFLR